MPARAPAASPFEIARPDRVPFYGWLAIALAACVPFTPALSGPFLFDDHLMLRMPEVARADGWTRLFGLAETRPITLLTFWANFHGTGPEPFAWHIVNLALHALNSVLVLFGLRQWISARAAIIAALLFAIHPLQVEPVGYVFARSTLLATTFCLAAFWLWGRGRRWWSVVLFGLGMLAKEECAAFPIMLGLLHWTGGRSKRERVALGAMIAVAVAAGLRVLYATSVVAGAGAGFGGDNTPLTYLSAQGIAIWRYLRLLIVPYPLSVDPQIGVTPTLAATAWIALAAVIGFAAMRARRSPAALWFLCGLILLAPSSSILPADDLAADRRLYLPLLAFAAAAAILLDRLPIRPTAFVIVPLLGAVSWVQSGMWSSEYRLWRQATDLAPEKVRPRIQLARAASPAEGEAILRAAAERFPRNSEIWNELGQVLLKQQRAADALGAFGRALALSPGDGRVLNNRGVTLALLDQRDAAIADFRRAIAADGCLADAHENLRKLGENSETPARCR